MNAEADRLDALRGEGQQEPPDDLPLSDADLLEISGWQDAMCCRCRDAILIREGTGNPRHAVCTACARRVA